MAIYPPIKQNKLRHSLGSDLKMVYIHFERTTSTINNLRIARLPSISDNLNMEFVSKLPSVEKQKESCKFQELKKPINISNNSKRTTSTSREHYRPLGKQPPLHRKRPENVIGPSDKVIDRIIELGKEIQNYREKEARIIPSEGKSHHLRSLESKLKSENNIREEALYGKCSG